MNDRVTRYAGSLLVFVWFVSSGPCSTVCAGAAESGPITVTDFRAKHLVFSRPVTRIVCLIESALSGIYMLGAENHVVGISRSVYSDTVNSYYSAMDQRILRKELPAPGNWDHVNIESVIALRPDLVIVWAAQSESIEALEQRGVKVYGVFLNRIDDVYREMRALGSMTGSAGRAEDLIGYTRHRLDEMARRLGSIGSGEWPSVYHMWAQGPLETSCGESTVNDVLGLAGARNVCASLPREHLVVNMERILSWNPSVIVMWYNPRLDPDDLIKRPEWKLVSAVRNRRVHEFPDVFLCDLWTLKFQYAAWLIAKWTHPDCFHDIDLEQEGKKMLHVLYDGKLDGR